MHRNRTWLVDATETVLRTQRNRILPIEGGDGSTLTLDFTTGVLDPRLTFTRASGGTYVGNNGYIYGMDFATSISLAIGTGSKTVTLTAPLGVDRRYLVGQTVYFSNGANNMSGPVTAYSASTQSITINATASSGSGSFTSWTVGNASARFDHDPTTKAPRGLLIEAAATNLSRSSQNLTDNNWTQQFSYSATSATGGIAPNGTITGNLFTEPSSNQQRSIYQSYSSAAGTYTGSLWIKQGSGDIRYIRLVVSSGSSDFGYVTVNANTGLIQQPAATVGTATNASATVTPYLSGWTRVTLTVTLASPLNFFFSVPMNLASIDTPTTNYGRVSYLGDGSTFLLWGAQVESGSVASSYIPTGASQGSRVVDECSMTGTNFSSWFTNSAEGSFYAKYSMNNPAAFFGINNNVDRYAFEISNSNGASRVFTNASYRVTTANAAGNAGRNPRVFDLNGTIDLHPSLVATAAQNTALAWGYKTDNNYLAAVGVTATDPNGTLPTGLDRIHIGASRTFGSTTFLNGCITQLKYWPTRLSNAQLEALIT